MLIARVFVGGAAELRAAFSQVETGGTEVCEALRKRFATWGELLDAAGVEHVCTERLLGDLEPPYRVLDELYNALYQLGLAPRRREGPGEQPKTRG